MNKVRGQLKTFRQYYGTSAAQFETACFMDDIGSKFYQKTLEIKNGKVCIDCTGSKKGTSGYSIHDVNYQSGGG
jgi:hypothetical protein